MSLNTARVILETNIFPRDHLCWYDNKNQQQKSN